MGCVVLCIRYVFSFSSDMVVVFLAKTELKKWGGVTAEDVLQSEGRKPKVNPEDPNSGMMDLMKQMYLDGDDKMKQVRPRDLL